MRIRLGICPVLLFAFALTLTAQAAEGPRTIVPDPRHPGYYKAFRCLSVDRAVRGTFGAIRNSCGHAVEAYWRSASGSGSMWTIPANDLYPLFEEVSDAVLGCLPNDHLHRSLELCRDSRQPASVDRDDATKPADAATRAADPGTSALGEDALGEVDATLADTLERTEQLRLNSATGTAAEAQRRLGEVSGRASAGGWSNAISSVSKGAITANNAYNGGGIIPSLDNLRSQSNGSGHSGSDNDNCRTDPVLVSQVQGILENCGEQVGICGIARAKAACYSRVAVAAGSCASVVEQARDMQRQYEETARQACAR